MRKHKKTKNRNKNKTTNHNTSNKQNKTKWFEITPTDTLFFRDGRPFNQDETITLAGVKSIFPPSPATVAGAIMATYAKQLGWEACGAWGSKIKDKLENKAEPLIFSGVFLKKGEKILFPVPQHLIELRPKLDEKKLPSKKRKSEELYGLAFLTPSTKSYKTDMGKVCLPEVKDQIENSVIKPLEGYWITQAGLTQCLKLQEPDKETLYHQSELWQPEPKVGIERDQETHGVKQGMLYSSTHIRLCAEVSIVIGVEHLPDKDLKGKPINIDNELIILGGEARTASLKKIPLAFNLADRPKGNLIYIASPTPMADPQLIPNIKTACMPRQMRIGGWDSVAFKPRPLTPFLVPGTVLFMQEAVEEDWLERLEKPAEFSQINSVYGQYFLGEYHNDDTK